VDETDRQYARDHHEPSDAEGRERSQDRPRWTPWHHGHQDAALGGRARATRDCDGQTGSWFRSYDKATGEIVSEILLPANTTGVPMTYMMNNKQYIVVAVSAPARPAELIALALP